MAETWEPSDYSWDAEGLVSVNIQSGVLPCQSPLATKRKSGSKARRKPSVDAFCQVEGCNARLEVAYYKKYRVCPSHAKAPAVVVLGKTVRFCQKCARFHDLAEFDLDRRSCRTRLAEHNRRRREMTMDRNPRLVNQQADSQDAATNEAALAASQHEAASKSSYHTPCSSAPSISEVAPSSARTAPALARPHEAEGKRPQVLSMDDLMGPLGHSLHSLDQIYMPVRGVLRVKPTALEVQAHDAGLPRMSCLPPTSYHAHAGHSSDTEDFNMLEGALDALLVGLDPTAVHADPWAGHAQALPPNQQAIAAASAAMSGLPPLPSPAVVSAAALGPIPMDDLHELDLEYLEGLLIDDPAVGADFGPPPPPYQSPDVVVQLSLKLFSCLPTDLPTNMRSELERALAVCPNLLEGYVRPGCTHVTVDVRVPAAEAQRLQDAPLDERMAELVRRCAAAGQPLPTSAGMIAQMGSQVAVLRDDRVLGVADLGTLRNNRPRVAATSRVCLFVEDADAAVIDLHGAGIGRPGDVVLCRQHGRFVTTEVVGGAYWRVHDDALPEDEAEELDGESATGVLEYEASLRSESSFTSRAGSDAGGSTSGASSSLERASKAAAMDPAVSVRLLGLDCGVAEVEVQVGGVMTAPRPLLVLPDARAAAEVEVLAARARRAPWMDSFLRDTGVVVAHICSEGAAARAPAEVVEALAAQTAEYAKQVGCPALARLLRRALHALRRAIGTDDTASAMMAGQSSSTPEKGAAAPLEAVSDEFATPAAAAELVKARQRAQSTLECTVQRTLAMESELRRSAANVIACTSTMLEGRQPLAIFLFSLAVAVAARLL